MKGFLQYIIYTNLVVAVSAGLLSAGFCFFYEVENWSFYGLFAFFSTLTVYNAQRILKTRERKKTEWILWVKKRKKALIVMVMISFVASATLFFLVENQLPITYFLLATVGCISIFYVVRVKGRNMRELPYIKIHLIALSWVIVLILFPIINENVGIIRIFYAFAFYIYIIAVTIPFDIRDLKYDQDFQRTIPQLMGVTKAKILSVVLLVIFFLLMTALSPDLKNNHFFVISIIVQLLLVVFMNEKRGDYYCAGLIDGAIGLMGLSFFLGSFL